MSYSDIKRYNLDPAFLFKMAKLVIADMRWLIQREGNSEFSAAVPKVNGTPAAVVTVEVRHGHMIISSETADSFDGGMENKVMVDRFIQALNQCISEAPTEQRRSLKESYGLSFK